MTWVGYFNNFLIMTIFSPEYELKLLRHHSLRPELRGRSRPGRVGVCPISVIQPDRYYVLNSRPVGILTSRRRDFESRRK